MPSAAEARVEGRQRRVVALLGVPELGAHEVLVARDPARAKRLADALLVAVERRGVYEPVAECQAGRDLSFDVRALIGFVRAESEAVHPDAGSDLHHVGERNELRGFRHREHLLSSSVLA